MAQITAQMVKDLREMTGAGMMDCKSALGETAGDVNAAVDWLRKKGLSKAAKKADRVAAEGLIGVAVKGTKGVVVEVNSETDFVARNGQFQGLVKMIAQVALQVGADLEKIKAAKIGNVTVETAIADAIATIGENMSWSRWNPPARPTSSLRSAGSSPCMSQRPIRRRSIPRGSTPRRSRARRMCSPKNSRRKASPPR